jgi:hypothetical protein
MIAIENMKMVSHFNYLMLVITFLIYLDFKCFILVKQS